MVIGTPCLTQTCQTEMQFFTSRLATSTFDTSGGKQNAGRPHKSLSDLSLEGHPVPPAAGLMGPRSRALVQVLHGTPKCMPQIRPDAIQPLS